MYVTPSTEINFINIKISNEMMKKYPKILNDKMVMLKLYTLVKSIILHVFSFETYQIMYKQQQVAYLYDSLEK